MITNDKKIKVLIVDDSAVVRQALEEVLSSDPAIQVIAEDLLLSGRFGVEIDENDIRDLLNLG